MAYISYPGYTPPTAWSDYDMDWDNPDPSNRVYLDCLWQAFQERVRVVESSVDLHPLVHVPTYNSPAHPSYSLFGTSRISYMRKTLFNIGGLNLMKRYWVENPVASEYDHRPLITLYDYLIDSQDTVFGSLSLTPGELLMGTKSVECFKAFKHLFDMMTIVDNQQSRYVYDMWQGDDNGDEVDSWESCWTNVTHAANFTVTEDVRSWNFGGVFRGRDNGVMSAAVDVKWEPYSTLAHKLLVQFQYDIDPPTGSGENFYRFWDTYGLGFVGVGYNAIEIPAGGHTTQITNGFVPPGSYVGWDYVNLDTPYSGTTIYTGGSIGTGWVDFGVKDGFSFQPTQYSEE